MNARYLKNNGTPVSRTFPPAHFVAGKNGKQVLVKKQVRYYDEKGRLVEYLHDKVDEAITVMDYPHIIDFRYGQAGFPDKEKHINILVGQTIKTSDEKLFQTLWKQFAFLDEVDEKGGLVKKNSEPVPMPKGSMPGEASMARALGEQLQ